MPPTTDTRWTSMVDQLSTTNEPTRQDVVDIWRRGSRRFTQSRNEILDAQDLETGALYLASPEALIKGKEVVFDPYARRLPQRWLLPLHMEQSIATEMPDYLREALTGSDQSNIQAQKVEAWLRGVRSQKLPWTDGIGKMVRAGQFASYLLPSSAAFEKQPSYMDTLGNAIRKEWWRDADGEPTTDEKRGDLGKSARAYKDALQRWRAGRVPFTHRLISPTDCIPFFERGGGRRRYDLTTLLVRTLHDRESLFRRGYRWEGLRDMALPTGYAQEDYRGANGQFYLYELLWYDEQIDQYGVPDRVPMLTYSVAGVATTGSQFSRANDPSDTDAEATINLRERYGMMRHLMGYYYGWKRAGEDNPDLLGIPYMTPLKDLILGTETLISSTEKHAKGSAFCGYQYVPNQTKTAGSFAHGLQGPTNEPPELPGSGEAIAVDGEYKPIAPAPIGPEVRYMIELGLQQLQINTPDPQLAGGQGDDSGHKVSLLHALNQNANSHYREGAREWVEDFGEWALELGCTLIEHFKLDDGIPVEENLPPQIDTEQRRSPRASISLTPNMVGWRYGVTAFYPSLGSVPEVQQISELYDKHQASWDDLMEARGKNDAMGELIKIVAHWQLVGTEQGQADLRVLIARYRGDEEKAQQLIAQGQMTPDGSTTAEITPEAMQAAQGAVGRQMPSFGGAAIGGQMSAALGTGPANADGIAQSAVAGSAPAGAGAGAVGL